MARRQHTPEQIHRQTAGAGVVLAQGQSVAQVCRALGVTEQTYYRWRKEMGGMRVTRAGAARAVGGRKRAATAGWHAGFRDRCEAAGAVGAAPVGLAWREW